MPELHCGKCGTIVQPTDLFCRICGFSLNPTTTAEERTQNARLERAGEGLDGRDVFSSPESPMTNRKACLVAMGLVFSTLVLMMVLFIFMGNRSGNRSAFEIEFIGTSTPYPTHKPYPTDTPYKTATPYPPALSYPITGVLARVSTGGYSGCELRIKNQIINLDSVIILSTVDTNVIAMTVYVRANDSLSTSGISTGTYYTYVTTGRDWDNHIGRFSNNAMYYRFEEQNTFDTCTSGLYGSYQYLEITLNITEGSGSDIVSVPPDSFPSVSP